MIKRKWVLIGILGILCIVVSAFFSNKILITGILVVWSGLMLYTLDDLENRSAFFAFLSSFFVFLIGRETLERFGFHTIEATFDENINLFAELTILISLVSLQVGYLLFGKVKVKKKYSCNISINYNSDWYVIVRKVSKSIFYWTYIFNLAVILDIVLFVAQRGYLAFYTSYVSKIPYIIGKIGDMSAIAFWIYMSTMPTKKESKIQIGLYILYLIITLGTGKRYPFVAGLLTLFVYYVMRNNVNIEREKWFGKREKMFVVLMLPIFMVFLFSMNLIRYGENLSGVKLMDGMTEFIYDQGVSINVIKRGEIYKDLLPANRIYTFGSTIEFLQGNIISRFLGITSYSGNTIEHAMQGHSFQHALSYVSMGNYYLTGRGLGSCYIAEVFHDFGYVGIIAINILYGAIFRKMFDFRKRGIWTGTVTLLALNSMFLAPRGSADGFIADIVDMTAWGTILIVWIISKLLYRKR